MKTSSVPHPASHIQHRATHSLIRTSARAFGCWMFAVAAAHAGPRTSASYTGATDSADSGGKRATSATYTNDPSIGGTAGISTATAPSQTAKHGYIGQLYDPSALLLSASPLTTNEGATGQVSASLFLDDATFLAVPAANVAWSTATGPLTLSGTGLATAGVVYQNTAATAQGVHLDFTGTLGLTVLETIADNFGLYAGDGLPDSWQVFHFGIGNPNAAPLLVLDADGWDNLFEYRAGLVPTDPLSTFTMSLSELAGTHRVTFASRFPDCTYTLLGSDNLSLWAPVAGSITDTGTITDPTSSTGLRRSYRIEAQRP